MKCHGCEGRGWVDSQYKGAMLCPVCHGSGKVTDNQKEVSITSNILPTETPSINKNPLLLQLENWIKHQKDIKFDHSNKTMNTYRFMSKTKGRVKGLVWVSTYGAGRIYLYKDNYSPVDPQNKVKYQKVWGNYPQFEVVSQGDVEYAKKLISYALNNF